MPPTGKRTCREARFDVRSRIRLGRRVTCCLSCRPRPPAGNIRRWAPCGSPWPHLVEGRYDTSSSCTPLDPAHWTHSIWQCRRNRLCRGWSHPSRHFPALPGTSRHFPDQAAPSFVRRLRRTDGVGLSPPLEQQPLTAHKAGAQRVRDHLRRPYRPERAPVKPDDRLHLSSDHSPTDSG
jgi:hypothetical protein